VSPASTARPTDTDVADYALSLGDDVLILGQRLCEWNARAPQLEDDVALLNIALDLVGQARALLTYAGQRAGRGESEDDLAFLRGEPEFRNAQIMELPNGDFGRTIARQLLVSAWHVPLWAALESSTDDGLAAIAAKAVKEARYHLSYARHWVLRLGDGTAESHRRMQDALDYVWPFTAELFESGPLTDRLVRRGVAAGPGTLEGGWCATVGDVLREATLAAPDVPPRPAGGRRGLHTETFGPLLAELQHLHRSHPGAGW
jgi:ring-1,2-phenylacetyl-CoA epoxidase subunit PaaC